ncbi:hypothetical protein NPIL_207371 [Nephila pilipes]|uniref:Uncharacterized protein n=1 Tax=Nephila pilipes TaxID=299642 RepID=A0A8X6R4F1_NEPPI|nr:hypothetical protein NPIL_207371 [Nephila pilipes]
MSVCYKNSLHPLLHLRSVLPSLTEEARSKKYGGGEKIVYVCAEMNKETKKLFGLQFSCFGFSQFSKRQVPIALENLLYENFCERIIWDSIDDKDAEISSPVATECDYPKVIILSCQRFRCRMIRTAPFEVQLELMRRDVEFRRIKFRNGSFHLIRT